MTNWHDIVNRNSSMIWQTAYKVLGDHHEAAECYQDTFLTAVRISREQKVLHWTALLKRVCTCRALDMLRFRYREKNRSSDLDDMTILESQTAGPARQAESMELSEKLRWALSKLPAKHAEVFCLRCMNEMNYRDIAKQLNLRTSAVGVIIHRARKQLREVLSGTDFVEDLSEQSRCNHES
jgi:RNA polymerase sigma factor (sigma-70 family)